MKIKDVLKEMVTSASVGQPTIPERLFKPKHLIDIILKKKKKKKNINEAAVVKFRYTNYKNDKTPKVAVLDFDYEGRPGQKTYGQRKDVLGWNINYFENKEEAVNTIQDIDTFAKMVSANNLEKYKRIKYFFPEQAEFIRRYNKDFIKNLKIKKGWFWTRASIEDAKKSDTF